MAPSQLLVVACYDRFNLLPHAPKGSEAVETLHVLRLNNETGELTPIAKHGQGVHNPAFSREDVVPGIFHTCTETIKETGEVITYQLQPNGDLAMLGRQNAEGYSTCYLTFDKTKQNIMVVNYWDSLVGTFPMQPDHTLAPLLSAWRPHQRPVARSLEDHLRHRQTEPHAHCLEFDPSHHRVAYVPDLGLDCVKQFAYDAASGQLSFLGDVPTAEERAQGGEGPRYIEFHPSLPVAYVVNELSSTVSVFDFDAEAAAVTTPSNPKPTLSLKQRVSTIPTDGSFTAKNTCGRVAVHPSGRFVLTSNRGHDSISVHSVDATNGLLTEVGIFPVQGRTPRHFQFDRSGRLVLSANQDTDSLTVFRLADDGALSFTGHVAHLPSPNFVLASALEV